MCEEMTVFICINHSNREKRTPSIYEIIYILYRQLNAIPIFFGSALRVSFVTEK